MRAGELAEILEAAARRGGSVLRERFGRQLRIEHKGKIDLVTDADRASEEAVLEFLRRELPGWSTLAEEAGAGAGEGHPEGRLLVDPLDGTTNYAHGIPIFCVTIAAETREGLEAGVIYDPLRDECFVGARGEGAQLNGEPIRPTRVDRLDQALLCTGFPYDVHSRADDPAGLFRDFIVRAQAVRRFGSAAIDLAYVACGRLDGHWEMALKPWDIAAGCLIVAEAGGTVTDLDGGSVVLERGDVLTSGGPLHPLLLEVIAGWRRTRSEPPPASRH